MKLTEMIQPTANKKLDGDIKTLIKALAHGGFKAPDFKVAAFLDSANVVKLVLEYQRYVDEEQFDLDVSYAQGFADSAFAPTRIVDKSYFGGANISLLRRGKKIDTDALMSDIELELHFPANRYT